jgi:hypothetical protein
LKPAGHKWATRAEVLKKETTMKTATFLEFVGETSHDALLTLTYENQFKPTVEEVRTAFPLGFLVSAQIEQQIPETLEERKTLEAEIAIQTRIPAALGIKLPGRKVVGLVLTPK